MRRLRPLQALDRQIERWTLRRIRRSNTPVTVLRNRIYILPTRFGVGFALLSFIMLLGSMNYSNSMGFALTFLLGALGLVCMHHTHANLAGLRVRPGHATAVFAGEPARFEVMLEQTGQRPRFSIVASWPRSVAEPAGEADVPLTGAVSVTLAQPTLRRGWHDAPVFSLASDFPLGLFRAWTLIELDQRVLVYPRPAAAGERPPLAAPNHEGEHHGSRTGQDRFAGLRSYQRGDALNTLHWKSLPKSRTPMVKQFEDPEAPECWLDLTQTSGVDLEARLALLTRWVIDLDHAGARYGLRLPGAAIPLGQGGDHRHQCLKALALHGLST